MKSSLNQQLTPHMLRQLNSYGSQKEISEGDNTFRIVRAMESKHIPKQQQGNDENVYNLAMSSNMQRPMSRQSLTGIKVSKKIVSLKPLEGY